MLHLIQDFLWLTAPPIHFLLPVVPKVSFSVLTLLVEWQKGQKSVIYPTVSLQVEEENWGRFDQSSQKNSQQSKGGSVPKITFANK